MPYIYEMFPSIQGEGAYMGYPAYFVRFAGCNVYCEFCDTADAQNFMDGEFVNHDELNRRILDGLERHSCNLVVFTGGEPALQCHELNMAINHIYHEHPSITIQVETSGSVEPTEESGIQELFDLNTAISLSPKKVPFMHTDWLVYASQLKVLVGIDGPVLPHNFPELDCMIDVFTSHGDWKRPIYFQPVAIGGRDKLTVPQVHIQKAIDYAKKYNGALGVQLHKYLGIR